MASPELSLILHDDISTPVACDGTQFSLEVLLESIPQGNDEPPLEADIELSDIEYDGVCDLFHASSILGHFVGRVLLGSLCRIFPFFI